MAFRVKYISVSSVKRTDVGESLHQFGCTNTVSKGLPNVNLISSSLGRKTQYFSCTGGIL